MIKSNKPLIYSIATTTVNAIIECEIKTSKSNFEDNSETLELYEFYIKNDIRLPIGSRTTTLTIEEIDFWEGLTQREKIELALMTKFNVEKWYGSSGSDFVID